MATGLFVPPTPFFFLRSFAFSTFRHVVPPPPFQQDTLVHIGTVDTGATALQLLWGNTI